MNERRGSANRSRDQRGVDPQPGNQPADRDPSPAGSAQPLLDALEIPLLAQAPGKSHEAAVADRPRPAVADQRARDAGDQRQRDERVGIQPPGCDEQTGDQQGQLAGGERQRDARLLGEQQRGEQRESNRAVQTRQKVHRPIIHPGSACCRSAIGPQPRRSATVAADRDRRRRGWRGSERGDDRAPPRQTRPRRGPRRPRQIPT